jgi:hypothetical protein
LQSNDDASGKKARKIREFQRVTGVQGQMFPVETEPLGKDGQTRKINPCGVAAFGRKPHSKISAVAALNRDAATEELGINYASAGSSSPDLGEVPLYS